MNGLSRAIVAGAVGSLTTNALHEITRRWRRDAPRVDILGMQALAKSLASLAITPPTGSRLYRTTLVADLVSNAAYFALSACAPGDAYRTAGTALGLLAGAGAVALPGRMGLSELPTNRTPLTALMSVGLYTAGGFAAGLVLHALSPADPRDDAYLRDKHVVITGGSRGLGFVLARRMLEAGARVTICGRSPDSLAAATRALDLHAGTLAAYPCDVRDRAACDNLVALATENGGPIDILINNVGVIEVGPAAEQGIEDYREAMDTHFWGPLYTSLAVLPAMRARGAGHIVNVASIGGVVGVPHLAPYSASKFAQIGLTQALGAEVAADGVRLTSIVPGLMITGSPDRAIFKGRNRAEYAWFTLSDANPLISVAADVAARRIIRAIRRGESQAVIGSTAKIAKTVNALWPETTAALLRLAAKLLPAPGGVGSERRTGAQSRSAWTQNPLTLLNARAAERNNQRPEPPV